MGCPRPHGRLREAWVVYRHGATTAGDTGSGWAGTRRPGQERLAARAIALYEAFADQRPPFWPASGAVALTVLAAQQRAASLAGDVARLLILGKDMRAAALERDSERLAAMRRRAEHRNAPRPPGRFEFRTASGWVTAPMSSDQRAPSGTQNTFSEMYSSRSSRTSARSSSSWVK